MSTSTVVHHAGAPPNGGASARHHPHLWAHRIDRRKHCVVLRVEGELDAAAYPRFRQLLDEAVRTPCDAVVIDLRAARFLSLRSAATLVPAREFARRRGIDLRLVTGRREIERPLELTGARPAFPYYPSMRAALDS